MTTAIARRIKVQIKVTVEVDPEDWCATYGCERSEVREDVRSYFVNQITQAAASDEVDYKVRVA